MADLVTREKVQADLDALGPNHEEYYEWRMLTAMIALYDENAELRRWLGAAAKLIEEPYWEPFEGALRGVSAHRTSSTFRALSRGEPVSEDVRRLYLGDEVSEE